MKVTNTSLAPQGVHTLSGVTYVMPNESKELALNQDQADLASQTGFLTLEGKPTKAQAKAATLDSIDIPDNEVDQLRQQLDDGKTENSRLTALVGDRDAEIADLKAKSADDTLTTEIARLNGVVTDRETEITGLKALVAEHEATIEQLKASVAAAAQQPDTGQGQQTVTPVGPFEVRDTSAGWFGIFGADGNQVGKSIRSADADAFKAMDAEAQLAYLTAPVAPAST